MIRYLSSIFLLSMFCLFSGITLQAEIRCLSSDNILVTHEGLFAIIDNHLTECYEVTHLGDGIYRIEYYGSCGRCGWAVDETGKCKNRNCNQYGPNRD